MKEKIIFMLLGLVAIIGIVPAFANNFYTPTGQISSQYCIEQMKLGHTCYEYKAQVHPNPATSQHQKTTPSTNWQMDIMAPDGTCNISGVFTPSGTCTKPSVVLSNIDFNTLQTNISVLAVVNIQQSAMPAQDYCQVAIWTWDTQGSVFQSKYNESLVVPPYCNSPVPEFGPVASIVLIIAVLSIVIFMHRTRIFTF